MWRLRAILLVFLLIPGCPDGGNGPPDSGPDGDGYVDLDGSGDDDCMCVSDEDCPTGHFCNDDCACQPRSDCEREGDCPRGMQCYDRTCYELPECDSSADCPQNRFCDPFLSYCVRDKFCLSDLQCRFGTHCVGSQCMYLSMCDSDEDCLAGNRCIRHNCRPVPDCRDDAECLPGERCELGFCQPVTCEEDRDCRHDWYCFGAACLPRFPCDSAADCPFGMPCTNWLCEDPEGCVVQADCMDGEVCFWGTCVVLPVQECQHDSDCPQDSICEFGGCAERPECQVDDDCPAGQRCIGEMCKPYLRCDESADPAGCPRGYRCEEGSCIFQAQCASDQDCISLFSCRDGMCTYSGACQTEADCPFGFACESGTCADQQWCDQDNPCPDGMECSANRCGPARECVFADDCAEGSFCSLVTGECRVIPACPGPEPCRAEPDGPGPYPVGVITLTFMDAERQRELVTEIWYPAVEEARSMPTDKVEMGPGLWIIDSGAHRDAPVRSEAGPCPLIVYSHGGRGWRTQFVSYTVRMASHGYVVMAPNHAGDTFLDPTETDPIQLTTDRVTDVDFMIDQAVIINAQAGGPLEGMLDTDRVSATGLCYGGVTALLAAFYVERLTVSAPHAPSGVHHADPEHFQQVTIPVMLFGSELDPDPTPETLLYAFSELGGTAYMAEFLRAGHIHLSDICAWDPFTLEACGPQFIPQRMATEIAMFYNLAFFNRYLKDDASMDSYLSLEFSARIPEILYWPVR